MLAKQGDMENLPAIDGQVAANGYFIPRAAKLYCTGVGALAAQVASTCKKNGQAKACVRKGHGR